MDFIKWFTLICYLAISSYNASSQFYEVLFGFNVYHLIFGIGLAMLTFAFGISAFVTACDMVSTLCGRYPYPDVGDIIEWTFSISLFIATFIVTLIFVF